MCLNPLRIQNTSHYREECDPDFWYVPCGRCEDCFRARRRDWRIRLIKEYELGSHFNCLFVTLNFDNEHLPEGYDVAPLLRKWRDRVRKTWPKKKRRMRYWFCTELGPEHGRLHLHGLVFNWPGTYNDFRDKWSYGFAWVEPAKTVGAAIYCCKYCVKDFSPNVNIDPDFIPRVYCSAGIGRAYLCVDSFRYHSQNGGIYTMHTPQGPVPLPRYYRDRIFSRWEIVSKRMAEYLKAYEARGVGAHFKRGSLNFWDAESYYSYLARLFKDSKAHGKSFDPLPKKNLIKCLYNGAIA